MILPAWRPMTRADLLTATAMGNSIFPHHHERPEVFEERWGLFSSGCFVLQNSDGMIGYAVSHPIALFDPPPLDSLISKIDPHADSLYVHDVSILPAWQKKGLGSEAIKLLKELARGKGLLWMSLVSVNGSRPFWGKHGFQTFHFVIGETNSSDDKIRSQGSGAVYMTTCRF